MKYLLLSVYFCLSFSANAKPGDCELAIDVLIDADRSVTYLEATKSTLAMVNKLDVLSDRYEERLREARFEVREAKYYVRKLCKD